MASLLMVVAAAARANLVDSIGDLPAGFAPAVATIVGGGRVHFVKQGGACPSAAPACAEPAFVVPGDSVVVLGTKGGYADAIYTGAGPGFRSTRGWIAQDRLSVVPAVSRSTDWLGHWASGDDSIDVTRVAGGRLKFAGTATWGGDDPARVAAGDVHVGDFSTSLTPAGSTITFTPDPQDAGGPARLDPPLAGSDCVLRMWQLGPYLLVSDNIACGGANVTFSNLYRRGT